MRKIKYFLKRVGSGYMKLLDRWGNDIYRAKIDPWHATQAEREKDSTAASQSPNNGMTEKGEQSHED